MSESVFTEIREAPRNLHTFHDSAEAQSTRRQVPSFVVYQPEAHSLFGSAPRIKLALEDTEAVFHEAGVFIPSAGPGDEDSLFVTSNRLSDGIRISKLNRMWGEWRHEQLPQNLVPMANGAVNYPGANGILFCAQGTKESSGGLQLVRVEPPHETIPVLSSFHGRWFNSPNDVVVAKDGCIWFTDPIYGFEQGFRPQPKLPSQVYRYDPDTGDVRAVADNFGRPNGLCFAPDEHTLYVTDTDWIHGDGTTSDGRVSHIYAFTVEMHHGAPFVTNRRLFAMADVGAPDGIKCDLQGNVYCGCGDGISIWAPSGILLGKIIIPGGVANFCFGYPGELFLLNEKRFWVACVSAQVQGALSYKEKMVFESSERT